MDIFSSICTKYPSDAGKFNTTDFIPVTTDSTVRKIATDGAIESLVVTAGSGYTDGTYYAPCLVTEQIKEHHLVQ